MAQEGQITASAPPEEPQQPVYPVLSGQPGQQPVQYQQYEQYQSQQPQQAIYANPQETEAKQLENEISSKFDAVIQKLTDKKLSIIQECQTANNEQKKDILEQLQHINNGIDEVKIDPNIKPKEVPKPQPVQPQPQQPVIVQQQQPQPQPQQVIVVQQQPQPQQNIKYISDTWNTNIAHPRLVFNMNTNSVTRTGKKGEWMNCFGNQIVTKGQYKKWEIKIIPKFVPSKQKDYVADVVIGIVDCKKLSNSAGGFWLGPMLGYGYYGFNGKKFHTNKKGKNYASKYNINDQISIEVNMQQFEMGFYVNGAYQGKAFPIDARLSYCLAVALCTPDYDVQIC